MIERNRNLVLRSHAEVWSAGDLAAVEELYSPDFVCHFLVGPDWRGPDGLRSQVARLRSAFPDWKESVEDVVAEGDRVVTRFTSTGTHLGEFQAIPATGARVVVREVAIHRIADGRIAEQWGFPDVAGLREQLEAAQRSGGKSR